MLCFNNKRVTVSTDENRSTTDRNSDRSVYRHGSMHGHGPPWRSFNPGRETWQRQQPVRKSRPSRRPRPGNPRVGPPPRRPRSAKPSKAAAVAAAFTRPGIVREPALFLFERHPHDASRRFRRPTRDSSRRVADWHGPPVTTPLIPIFLPSVFLWRRRAARRTGGPRAARTSRPDAPRLRGCRPPRSLRDPGPRCDRPDAPSPDGAR